MGHASSILRCPRFDLHQQRRQPNTLFCQKLIQPRLALCNVVERLFPHGGRRGIFYGFGHGSNQGSAFGRAYELLFLPCRSM